MKVVSTRLRALASVLVLVAAAGVSLAAHAGEGRSFELERQVLTLIDQERSERGLGGLRPDPILTEAAREHCRDMEEKGFFGHMSPTSGRKSPFDRYTRACGGRPQTLSIGENIYRGSRASAGAAHQAFMDSSGHRENLLRRNWRKVGVGIHIGQRGEMWVTQMFSD